MKILLDTSAWYAYIFDTDAANIKARAIIQSNPFLIIPFTVIEELAALIHHRKNKTAVHSSVYQALIKSPRASIIHITKKDHQDIWQLYQETPNKIDFVDASIVYFSNKLDLPIFTFDQHFQDKSLKLRLLKP